MAMITRACRSPLSTPRARTRTRTDAEPLASNHPNDPAEASASGAALTVTVSSTVSAPVSYPPVTANGVGGGTAGGVPYASAAAAAGAAGAMAAATATAAAAGGEPVKRQRGRFKLRDIGEVSMSSVGTTSASTSPAGVVTAAGGVGAPGGGQPHVTSAPLTAGSEPSPPIGAAVVGIPVTGADLHTTLLLLVEQNRQLLDRVAGAASLDSSVGSSAGPAPALVAQPPGGGGGGGSGGSAGSGGSGERPGNPPPVDRLRTHSMSALTLQAPLPPKPPGAGTGAGAGVGIGVGGVAPDRKESPLMREGTPAGWWGSQGQPGQPPRRPTSAGMGRSEMGIVAGGVSAQGGAGGVGVAGIGVATKVRDDGTGRRAERGRLSTLLDQLKDEVEMNAASKRDMDLELKRVGLFVPPCPCCACVAFCLVCLQVCVCVFFEVRFVLSGG